MNGAIDVVAWPPFGTPTGQSGARRQSVEGAAMTGDTPNDHPETGGELRVEIEPFGPEPEQVERLTRELLEHQEVRGLLGGASYRLLSVDLHPPADKGEAPELPEAVGATFYDYTNNRAIFVRGPLDDPARATVREAAAQPLPNREEFQAAVELVARDDELGPALRDGALLPYRPMPPLIEVELPHGRVERTLAVGLLPAERGQHPGHQIVGANMITGSVERYDGNAPATARAVEATCGAPPDAGQATTSKGVAGQAWVSVFQGGTRLWRFLAVRPSASSGTWGSGVELRYVDYRDRRVLYQAHLPVLNVLYDGNACGPYRDWQYEEGMLDASGTGVAPGFLLCPSPAKTILDTGSDVGTFLGVAVYLQGQEAVLVSEMQAGWYRYVSEWRLHADGTIRPRFGFDATQSSCVCVRHHHHAYWRLDFDIETPSGNRVREYNDPPIVAGTHWHTKAYEAMRLRAPKRRWRVENTASGRGYTIVPGGNDGTASGDAYAKGDLWFLRYHPTEIDDAPIAGTEIQIDKYRSPVSEPIAGQDVVVWYGAHFTHDVTGPPVDHMVGPSLVPHGW
jgi:hypothetical protein